MSQAVTTLGAAGLGKITSQVTARNIAQVPTVSIGKILTNPRIIWGKSAESIAAGFRKAGYKVTITQGTRGSGKARIVRVDGHPSISIIKVHPGGGVHRGPYVQISTNKGKIKVINSQYRPTLEKNVTYVRVGIFK